MDREIKRDFRRTRDDAKEVAENKFEDAKEGMRDAAESAQDKTESFGERIKEGLIDAKDKVVEMAENVWDKMPSIRKPEDRLGDDIKETYKDTKEAARQKLDDLRSD